MNVFSRSPSEGWASISPRGTVPLRTARRVHVSTCTFTRCGLSFRAMPTHSPFECSSEVPRSRASQMMHRCVLNAHLASKLASRRLHAWRAANTSDEFRRIGFLSLFRAVAERLAAPLSTQLPAKLFAGLAAQRIAQLAARPSDRGWLKKARSPELGGRAVARVSGCVSLVAVTAPYCFDNSLLRS